jgi:hypothetical protein
MCFSICLRSEQPSSEKGGNLFLASSFMTFKHSLIQTESPNDNIGRYYIRVIMARHNMFWLVALGSELGYENGTVRMLDVAGDTFRSTKEGNKCFCS